LTPVCLHEKWGTTEVIPNQLNAEFDAGSGTVQSDCSQETFECELQGFPRSPNAKNPTTHSKRNEAKKLFHSSTPRNGGRHLSSGLTNSAIRVTLKHVEPSSVQVGLLEAMAGESICLNDRLLIFSFR
jgi:hypothetical protein